VDAARAEDDAITKEIAALTAKQKELRVFISDTENLATRPKAGELEITATEGEADSYDQWVTKERAAEIIGVSTKTVESFAAAGNLRSAKHRIGGVGAHRVVYHPDDVDRIAKERRDNKKNGR
jgi:hypothetical protein